MTRDNNVPVKPVNQEPFDGQGNLSPPYVLGASDFIDNDINNDPTEFHRTTHWRVTTTTGDYSDPVYQITTIVDLTGHTVPGPELETGTTYYWQVSYQDSANEWSPYSEETFFDTRANNIPDQPINLTPGVDEINVYLSPVLSAEEFADDDADNTHYASHWRITTTKSDYSNPVYQITSDTDLTEHIVPPDNPLAAQATYYWQVAYRDSPGDWSDYSLETSFTTSDNNRPATPVNNAPVNGAIKLKPALDSSAFDDPDGDAHKATRWEITTVKGDYSGAALAYDSGICSDLTDHTLKASLADSTTYYWRTRYQDDRGGWSLYSEETSFTTIAALPSGVVAFWKFDKGSGSIAYDSTQNDNDLTRRNHANWNDNSKYGKSMYFDGRDDYLNMPNSDSLNFAGKNQITIEAWIYPQNNYDGSQAIVSKGGSKQYALIFNRSYGYAYFETYQMDWSSCGSPRSADGSIPFDAWTHVVATYDGSIKRLYVNGEQVSSVVCSANFLSNTQYFEIGRNTSSQDFCGYIDEVVIYNHALTADEVVAQYNADGASEIGGAPLRPTNVSPVTPGNTDISLTPTLSASIFSDLDGDNHQSSRWQIRRADGSYGDSGSYETQSVDYLESCDIGTGIWSRWNYRRKIALTPATSFANYPVNVKLRTSNFDYSKANSDGSDIRFLDENENSLKYWIARWNNTGVSDIWVMVPNEGTSAIYIYYGNLSATSTEVTKEEMFPIMNDRYPNFPGWSDIRMSTCGPYGMMGGYNVFGNGAYTQKTVKNLDVGYYLITFDYYQIDDWNNEIGRFYWNDIQKWSRYHSDGGSEVCGWNNSTARDSNGVGNEIYYVIVNHSGGDATLKFTSSLNEGATNESWGVNNISISKIDSSAQSLTALVGSEEQVIVLDCDSAYYWHVQYRDESGVWSNYSEETSLITRSNFPPDKPTNQEPLHNSPTVNITPTLKASAFADDDTNNDATEFHSASNWQITTTSQDYSDPAYQITTPDYLSEFTLPVPLTSHISYYWRVAYQDANGSWSDYSDEFSFTTGTNTPPGIPVNKTPEDGDTGIVNTPTLTASAYFDSEGDSHTSTYWQITATKGNYSSPVCEITSSINLTGHKVGMGSLDYLTTYYWHVKYFDSESWSDWSNETSFTTGGEVLPGTVAYWKYNEGTGQDVLDLTTNYNDGMLGLNELAESTDPTWTTGKSGNALSFDGVDDFIQVPDSDSLEMYSTVTVETWVKLTGPSESMIRKPTSDWYLGWGDGTSDENAGTNPHFYVHIEGGYYSIAGKTPLEQGRWYHLVGTYSGATARIYVNGKEVPVNVLRSTVGSIKKLDLDLIIGNWDTKKFRGVLDETVIYNVALSEDDVANRYNQNWLKKAVAKDIVNELDGIQAGDVVVINFNGETKADAINSSNIDTALKLSNGHSWKDGSGQIENAEWSSTIYPNDTLTVTLSVGGGLPTVAVNDDLFLDGTIKGKNGEDIVDSVSIGGRFYVPFGAVGYWRFDEGDGLIAHDLAYDRENDGVISGPTWTTGRFDNALDFGGTNDKYYVLMDSSTHGSVDGLTVEARIYRESKDAIMSIVDKYSNRGVTDKEYLFWVESNNQLTFWLGHDDGNGANTATSFSSGVRVPTNRWVHVAATWDGSVIRLYMNGVEVQVSGTLDITHTPDGVCNLQIGRYNTGEAFDGKIDEVVVYDRAMSGSEIKARSGSWFENAIARDVSNGGAGIQAGDKVVIGFEGETSAPTIDKTNIDTILALSGNCTSCTWLDGSGNIGSAVWSSVDYPNDTLTIILSDTEGVPDVQIGDTITPSESIRDTLNRVITDTVTLGGAFGEVWSDAVAYWRFDEGTWRHG